MKYSPEHIREIGQISQETLRHWRTVLPPLSAKKGRNAFSLGDALAILVIKDLCLSLKIKISELVPFAETLFDICDSSKWDSYQNKILVFDPSSKRIQVYDQILDLNSVPSPAVLININMHVESLRKYALGIDDNDQLEIRFLSSVKGNRLGLKRSSH